MSFDETNPLITETLIVKLTADLILPTLPNPSIDKTEHHVQAGDTLSLTENLVYYANDPTCCVINLFQV